MINKKIKIDSGVFRTFSLVYSVTLFCGHNINVYFPYESAKFLLLTQRPVCESNV